jgi:glutamine synthetase type III
VLDKGSELIQDLQDSIHALEKALANHVEELTLDHATYALDPIISAMAEVHEVADRLECVVSDEFWTLPMYQKMLLIK